MLVAVRNVKELWQSAWRYIEALRRHDALHATSAMAFHAFFSLIPLVALMGWAAERLPVQSSDFLAPIAPFLPTAVAHLAGEEISRGGALVAPLSVVGFIWLSTGGVATAMYVFETIFEAPRRSWLHRRSGALLFVVSALVLTVLSGVLVLFTTRAGSLVANIMGFAVPVLALWFLIASFFRYATRRRDGVQRRGFRGALATLLLWLLFSVSFSLYVRELATYTEFYGGLATVVVLLVWLWLMALSLIVGGEINARLEGVRVCSDSRPQPSLNSDS